MSNERNLISIKQAASILGVTPLTLRNWDKSGKLIPMRHPINNYRVYRRSDIEALLEAISTNRNPVNNRKAKVIKKLEIKHIRD